MVHLFAKDVLRRCAEEPGFTVETPEYLCFRRFPAMHRTDGHEFLTLTTRTTCRLVSASNDGRPTRR
jgi:hypothetical protein